MIPGEPYEPRRVLVIIGDGHDNASNKTLQEALELAQRDLFTIYAVSTSSYGFGDDADDDVLVKLALATGGKVEYPLQNVYRDISGYLEVPTDGGNLPVRLGYRRIRRRQGQQHLSSHRQYLQRNDHAVHPALRSGYSP